MKREAEQAPKNKADKYTDVTTSQHYDSVPVSFR